MGWFPLHAEIEPRAGGRYWMSWGGDPEAVKRFETPWREMLERVFPPSVPSAAGSAD